MNTSERIKESFKKKSNRYVFEKDVEDFIRENAITESFEDIWSCLNRTGEEKCIRGIEYTKSTITLASPRRTQSTRASTAASLSDLTVKFNKLLKELSSAKEENERLKQLNNDEEKEELEEENKLLREELKVLQDELSNAEANVTELRETIEDSKDEIEEAESLVKQNDSLREDISISYDEIDHLKKKNIELSSKHKEEISKLKKMNRRTCKSGGKRRR